MCVKPQLAFDAKGSLAEIPRDGHWVLQPKHDGWRWQTAIDVDIRHWGGRNGKEWSGLTPHIDAALAGVPFGTILDSELIVRGGVSTDVARALRHRPEDLVLVVFDVIQLAGRDLTHGLRHGARRELLEAMDLGDEPCVQLITEETDRDRFDEAHASWLYAGLEGSVAKLKDGTYRPGKRSREWLKVKPFATCDGTVIGYEMGKGVLNTSEAGALVIRLSNGVETTAGFCHPVAEAEAAIGRIVELKHFGELASGKVRHPIITRFRDDLENA